ncbi:hypothetical protein F5Y16DRAFT_281435 [Xylariaceae sp. FL0255]|nr:hypothetical protein F5Y16DRAFT_281435 [Xylariaceae sp. FL0255]
MDTGDYETNILVVNNISSIAFVFYELAPSSTPFGSSASDIEAALRRDGYLVCLDITRKGFWCFRLNRKERSSPDSTNPPNFDKTIDIAGYTLSLCEEGSFEPASLVKQRLHGSNTINTPSSTASSASSALDPSLRSAQSSTAPPFPNVAREEDARAPKTSDPKSSSTTPIKDLYENLLSASYSSLCWCFCSRTGAIPLTSRSVLLTKLSQRESASWPPVIATLRVYLTTTGSMVVSLSHSLAHNLINVAESFSTQLPPLGVTVLAAPLGLFATCQPGMLTDTTTIDGSRVQSPDTQVLRLRSEWDEGPWRSICSKLLQSRTISLPMKRAQKWVCVQRMRQKLNEPSSDGKATPAISPSVNVCWPANLLFCKSFTALSISDDLDDAQSLQQNQNFDPLSTAKSWFSNAQQRESAIKKKERDREVQSAQDNVFADGQLQPSHGLSPLALQRPNQAGAPLAGVYPTPPDGVQGMIGVTPSMDGNFSSPGNNQNAPAVADADNSTHGPIDAFNENWENVEAKRERMSAPYEPENLFGELGPDMFGDNDITEADFSFFDEQPGAVSMSSLDLPLVGHADPTPITKPSSNVTQAQMKADSSGAKTPHAVPVSTFAKPELRHARSSLMDEARRQMLSDSSQTGNTGSKRSASPFNPDTVYKRIRASLDNRKAVQQNSLVYVSHHSSIFDKVNFGPSLSMVNSKYEGSGRFDFSMDQAKGAKPLVLDTPPTTDYLRRHGKGRKTLKELPGPYSGLILRIHGNHNSASNHPSPQQFDGSDADEASLVSDQDDSSCESDEPTSPVKSVSMRRRRMDDESNSPAASSRDFESGEIMSVSLPLELSRSLKAEVDLPLAKYFADPEPPLTPYSLRDEEFIMAAQLLTDQMTTSTLYSNQIDTSSLRSGLDHRRHLSSTVRNSLHELQLGLPSCFHLPTTHQFRSFIEVQDVPLLSQPLRMQPRPPGSDQMKPCNLFQIPSPRFEMRRYESKMSVLPSAVSFWESLGLSPSQGLKDVNALCLFPDYEGLADSMLLFTDRVRSVYESLRLGSFARFQTGPNAENGLFPFDIEKDMVSFGKSTSFLGSSLQNCASKICKILASASIEQTNFVLFFVYSPEIAGSIVECCAAFNEIFEGYKRVLNNKKLPLVNEIVLQLIPQTLVASTTSVPMPTPMELSRLALEVYDRCVLFGGAMPSPAVILEQTPPRMIDFKVTANPSASVMHENMCLHVAYAQSVDERWVTAAWTDNRGSQQMTASYCLGRKGKPNVTSMSEVIQEIWSTTVELISSWKVHWRIIVAKCGHMEAHEIDLWTNVILPETKHSVNLTLVTVDTDPSLQLLPPISKIPPTAISVFYSTPVSTPQAQGAVVSPEQSGNASTALRDAAQTPGDTANNPTDSDADITLVDAADQTWGAILSHRLPGSSASADLNPALVSGYLVKRGGTRIDDPPIVMEVNIVHSEGSPRVYEALLREMLIYYRGLGTLARARGTVDRDNDVRPWHVAAAEKGVRALYMLM